MFHQIADLIRGLAWPFVVLCALLVFRVKLGEVLRSLERIKFGSLEVELREQAAGVATALAISDDAAFPSISLSSDLADGTAIGVQYARLIKAVREKAGISDDASSAPDVLELVEHLLAKEVISAGTAEAIRGLTTLRNISLRATRGTLQAGHVEQFEFLTTVAINSLMS